MPKPIELIVGLGNPGSEYYQTRHNAGEDFVEELARQQGVTLKDDKKYSGRTAETLIGNRKVRLLVPTTFMNRSGKSVAALANFYKIDPASILVAHDELDLEPGIARLKFGGGHGGHNGLRDIISQLGNNRDFARLRIGIGHPGNAKLVTNHVLKKAPAEEFRQIEDASYESTRRVEELVNGDWDSALKQLHTSLK